MCAVTCCCPPMCGLSSAASGVVSCLCPRMTLHLAWLLSFFVVLAVGLGLYIQLTFLCQAVTARDLGHVPENNTGIWVNNSLGATQYAKNQWFPRQCSWPSHGICDDFVDINGHSAQEMFVLVNYTERNLGTAPPAPWSPSPLAYQGSGCWSEGSSEYFGQGLLASLFMSVGASGLLVAAIVKALQKAGKRCCGKPLADDCETHVSA